MYRCLLVITAVSLMTLMADAQETTETTDSDLQTVKDDQMSYFLGLSLGQELLRQGFQAEDVGPKSFSVGVADALKRADLKLTDEELDAVRSKLQELLQNRAKEMQAEMVRMAEANKEKGAAWLKENATKEGVKELVGGIQYKVLKSGEGASPSPSDTVSVHYTGTLTNGEVFDSSVQRGQPAQFPVGGVIKGWQMSLQKMKVGDKWMIYIPSELAYGERGSQGAIGPNEVLIFEVELLEIL